jgi:hypothetical protein
LDLHRNNEYHDICAKHQSFAEALSYGFEFTNAASGKAYLLFCRIAPFNDKNLSGSRRRGKSFSPGAPTEETNFDE